MASNNQGFRVKKSLYVGQNTIDSTLINSTGVVIADNYYGSILNLIAAPQRNSNEAANQTKATVRGSKNLYVSPSKNSPIVVEAYGSQSNDSTANARFTGDNISELQLGLQYNTEQFVISAGPRDPGASLTGTEPISALAINTDWLSGHVGGIKAALDFDLTLSGVVTGTKNITGDATLQTDFNDDLVVGSSSITLGNVSNTSNINIRSNNITLGNVSNSNTSNITVYGNLDVRGNTTTIESTTITVEDPIIKLAKDNTADNFDIGFYGKYVNTSTTTKYTGLIRDVTHRGDQIDNDYLDISPGGQSKRRWILFDTDTAYYESNPTYQSGTFSTPSQPIVSDYADLSVGRLNISSIKFNDAVKLIVEGKSFLIGDTYLKGSVGIGNAPESNNHLNVGGIFKIPKRTSFEDAGTGSLSFVTLDNHVVKVRNFNPDNVGAKFNGLTPTIPRFHGTSGDELKTTNIISFYRESPSNEYDINNDKYPLQIGYGTNNNNVVPSACSFSQITRFRTDIHGEGDHPSYSADERNRFMECGGYFVSSDDYLTNRYGVLGYDSPKRVITDNVNYTPTTSDYNDDDADKYAFTTFVGSFIRKLKPALIPNSGTDIVDDVSSSMYNVSASKTEILRVPIQEVRSMKLMVQASIDRGQVIVKSTKRKDTSATGDELSNYAGLTSNPPTSEYQSSVYETSEIFIIHDDDYGLTRDNANTDDSSADYTKRHSAVYNNNNTPGNTIDDTYDFNLAVPKLTKSKVGIDNITVYQSEYNMITTLGEDKLPLVSYQACVISDAYNPEAMNDTVSDDVDNMGKYYLCVYAYSRCYNPNQGDIPADTEIDYTLVPSTDTNNKDHYNHPENPYSVDLICHATYFANNLKNDYIEDKFKGFAYKKTIRITPNDFKNV